MWTLIVLALIWLWRMTASIARSLSTTRTPSLYLKAAAVVAFLIGTGVLYFGFTMTFLVPGMLGEPFFQKDRVLLGMLPLLAALLLLCSAGWLLFRSVSTPKRNLSDMIAYCFGAAIGMIFLFFII